MSEPPDNRFLALRSAGQDATDFRLPDASVRRYMELHDAGAAEDEIAAELDVDPSVVHALVAADERQALAHRIAAGEEPMYPLPGPDDRVVDSRSGSTVVPVLLLVAVLIGVIVYAALR